MWEAAHILARHSRPDDVRAVTRPVTPATNLAGPLANKPTTSTLRRSRTNPSQIPAVKDAVALRHCSQRDLRALEVAAPLQQQPDDVVSLTSMRSI